MAGESHMGRTLCSCLQAAGSACSGCSDRGFSQLCPGPACSITSCAHPCADASLTAPHSKNLQRCTWRCSPLEASAAMRSRSKPRELGSPCHEEFGFRTEL